MVTKKFVNNGTNVSDKMENLSRCIYQTYSHAISSKLIKSINQINFNHIWRNKIHYFKKGYMVKELRNNKFIKDRNRSLFYPDWMQEYMVRYGSDGQQRLFIKL